jgi:hypothetical protein
LSGTRLPTPQNPAQGRYRHGASTKHLQSSAIPVNLTTPQAGDGCGGLAHDWDAKVASADDGRPVADKDWLDILANMARQSCVAQITLDCAAGDPADAVSIQPLTPNR